MASQSNGSAFTRRTFMAAAGGAAAATLLAACSPGGSTKSGSSGGGNTTPIKFWNMPWGSPLFLTTDKAIVAAYKPGKGVGPATYQQIQWANFTQTFSSAVASNTGPAVSSGGGTQAFLFESQGKIAYADDLLDSWKKNGIYDDFLPGLVDTLKTKNGYAAVPYNLDMRVWWYNETILKKAGADVPTDWDSYEKACAALKKIGVYGYGTQSGAGANTGFHSLVSHMINNGGGLFDEKHQPNCVTPENIEAIEWVLGLIKSGYVDPRSSQYTSANGQAQWRAGKFGMGWDTAGVSQSVGGATAAQMKMGSPLTGPSGKKGALYFPNNIMMYKNTPSQKSSEAFLTYYYKNMSPLWTKNTGIGLPPLKSIANTAEFKANKNLSKAITEWQPISKTWGVPGSNTVFLNVTAVDGTPASYTFAQTILGNRATAKEALTALQNALKAAAKPNG
jgi:multiple sugar transport system substrate-binding protein